MTIKVGINGFGRMGRLTLRAAVDWPEIEFIKVNRFLVTIIALVWVNTRLQLPTTKP